MIVLSVFAGAQLQIAVAIDISCNGESRLAHPFAIIHLLVGIRRSVLVFVVTVGISSHSADFSDRFEALIVAAGGCDFAGVGNAQVVVREGGVVTTKGNGECIACSVFKLQGIGTTDCLVWNFVFSNLSNCGRAGTTQRYVRVHAGSCTMDI